MAEGRTTGRGWTREDLYEERLGRRRSDMLERRELDAAEGRPMNREYVVWGSPSLGRRMELLYFGHGGRPMIWFPTSVGRFYQNEDFGLIGAVADHIDAGRLQVVCVDSVDAESFYATARPPAERIRRHDAYDRYIAREVVPWILARALPAGKVGTLGTSFGAYHAVNFGLRHPDLCDKVVGFSGK